MRRRADGAAAGHRPLGSVTIRVTVTDARVDNRLASLQEASNNRAVDPVVLALAQLVRDRWEREQRERRRRWANLRVVAREVP
jgi:hypothetical protein